MGYKMSYSIREHHFLLFKMNTSIEAQQQLSSFSLVS